MLSVNPLKTLSLTTTWRRLAHRRRFDCYPRPRSGVQLQAGAAFDKQPGDSSPARKADHNVLLRAARRGPQRRVLGNLFRAPLGAFYGHGEGEFGARLVALGVLSFVDFARRFPCFETSMCAASFLDAIDRSGCLRICFLAATRGLPNGEISART